MGQSIFKNLKRFEDYQLILLGWVVVLAAVCLNCTAHSLFIAKERVDVLSSIGWSLKEFGVWLVMTPALCFALNATQYRDRPILHYLIIGLYAVGIALLVNTSVDVFIEAMHWQESLFFNWHKHVIAFGAIVVVWKMMQQIDREPKSPKRHLKMETSNHRNLLAPQQVDITPEDTAKELAISEVTTLKFSNPNLEIQQSDITFVQASGNYLEISTPTATHLVRLTLKELEAMLDDTQFFRCHRSFVVNLNKVSTVKNHRSGHGDVILCSGQVVPVSKSKRAKLREFIELA
ncbi:LytR/AlgR family response regulator transcription factor [Pseudoalteromonas luteoviolacea]|uniref:LytR/AlgR family response regulator transcription factor n=1 Tax=Pseudoalteromonas luteoviolacea TaxID=43657 RepID=UPI00114FE5B1|nr:LytTR family DNA-binding domain-containing protein [Pseudoalteromonas luteoviolacea]TQF67334.1 LytTR family transcriptional regulator [Pseudoalteromonas luteoviolacea]